MDSKARSAASGINQTPPTRTLWLVADQTSASIDIAAKPDDVMAVIADFEHYPLGRLDEDAGGTRLLAAKTVRMVLDHTLVKDNMSGVRVEAARRAGNSSRGIFSRRWTVPTC